MTPTRPPGDQGSWTRVGVLASSARRRVVLAVAAALVVGLGCVADVPRRTAEPAVVGSGCLPTGSRSSVSAINAFVDSSAGVPEFLGADVGVDVRLDDQRSLWLFGDTLRDVGRSGRFVRNSMLVFRPDCVEPVRPAAGGAVVPDRADGVGYWPMSGWRRDRLVAGSQVVDVMLQRVAHEDDQGLGIVTLGPTLATFLVPPQGQPRLVGRHDLGPDDPSSTVVEWGAASAVADGWLYLYGTSTRRLPGIHGFALRVARVRPGAVYDMARWRFWDGLRWQSDPGVAAALLPEQGGVSQTLSVWRQDGRWHVLSKRDEFLGQDVVVWPATSPVGPFDTAYVVAELPCDTATGELRYMPLAHPGLLPRHGSVVVSFSRNSTDVGEVCASPTGYRPHFLRVRLPD